MHTLTVVRPGDSFDRWHQATCRRFSMTECNKAAGRDFEASVTIRQFGDLALNTIWSRTQRGEVIQVARRSPDIRRDQRDYFMLWLMLSGSATLAQNGRVARLFAGDLVIQDQSRPFDLELGQLAHAGMIMIPRPLLTSRLPAVSDLAAVRVPGSSRLGAFAGSLVKELFALDETTSGYEVERRLGSSVLDIVSTAVGVESGGAASGARGKRQLDDVKRFMLANLQDCDLGVETIARARNMAPRTLYRLFALEGATPMGWLWQQRLAAGYQALSAGNRTQVTEVALNCGFRDVSHFSRAFKARFGVSPSAVKRGHPAQPGVHGM